MIGWIIPEPFQPEDAPDGAERAEHEEARAPAEPRHQPNHQGRCQSSPGARAHDDESMRGAAFVGRNPVAETAGHVRERASLADAEEESHHEERCEVPSRPGQRRECRPPQHDASDDFPRADHVAEPAARDFEGGVGKRERREHPADLDGRQVQLGENGRTRSRNGDPIEIGDDRERQRQAQHRPSRVRRCLGYLRYRFHDTALSKVTAWASAEAMQL